MTHTKSKLINATSKCFFISSLDKWNGRANKKQHPSINYKRFTLDIIVNKKSWGGYILADKIDFKLKKFKRDK